VYGEFVALEGNANDQLTIMLFLYSKVFNIAACM